MRTIIVGDIHGECDKFESLLIKIDFSEADDRLILLGDLIDRGQGSCRVVSLATELKKVMDDRLIILRGSHEKMLLSDSPKDKILRRIVGYGATVRSFHENGDDIRRYKEWFNRNTVTYFEDEHFQCAHAAVKTSPIGTNDEYTLTMNHSEAKKNRYNGKLTITGHIHLNEPTNFDGRGGKGFALAYEVNRKLPQNGVICIDTNCGNGGQLTAMIICGEAYRLECVR